MTERESALYLSELSAMQHARPDVARACAEHVVDIDRRSRSRRRERVSYVTERRNRVVPKNIEELVARAEIIAQSKIGISAEEMRNKKNTLAKNARQLALAIVLAIPMPEGKVINRIHVGRMITTDPNLRFSTETHDLAAAIIDEDCDFYLLPVLE
jgi:hypothetical protein